MLFVCGCLYCVCVFVWVCGIGLAKKIAVSKRQNWHQNCYCFNKSKSITGDRWIWELVLSTILDIQSLCMRITLKFVFHYVVVHIVCVNYIYVCCMCIHYLCGIYLPLLNSQVYLDMGAVGTSPSTKAYIEFKLDSANWASYNRYVARLHNNDN